MAAFGPAAAAAAGEIVVGASLAAIDFRSDQTEVGPCMHSGGTIAGSAILFSPIIQRDVPDRSRVRKRRLRLRTHWPARQLDDFLKIYFADKLAWLPQPSIFQRRCTTIVRSSHACVIARIIRAIYVCVLRDFSHRKSIHSSSLRTLWICRSASHTCPLPSAGDKALPSPDPPSVINNWANREFV